jgi:hypothetical protein
MAALRCRPSFLRAPRFGPEQEHEGDKALEMHSRQSLCEVHGISSGPRRQSRPGRIARRAITRLLAVRKRMKAAMRPN